MGDPLVEQLALVAGQVHAEHGRVVLVRGGLGLWLLAAEEALLVGKDALRGLGAVGAEVLIVLVGAVRI